LFTDPPLDFEILVGEAIEHVIDAPEDAEALPVLAFRFPALTLEPEDATRDTAFDVPVIEIEAPLDEEHATDSAVTFILIVAPLDVSTPTTEALIPLPFIIAPLEVFNSSSSPRGWKP